MGETIWIKSGAVCAQGKHHLKLLQASTEYSLHSHSQVAFTLQPHLIGKKVVPLKNFSGGNSATGPQALSYHGHGILQKSFCQLRGALFSEFRDEPRFYLSGLRRLGKNADNRVLHVLSP